MLEEIEAKSLKQVAKKLRFLPFALVGLVAFAINSNPDLHPYLQISIALFEAKLGILIVYFLAKKLSKPVK